MEAVYVYLSLHAYARSAYKKNMSCGQISFEWSDRCARAGISSEKIPRYLFRQRKNAEYEEYGGTNHHQLLCALATVAFAICSRPTPLACCSWYHTIVFFVPTASLPFEKAKSHHNNYLWPPAMFLLLHKRNPFQNEISCKNCRTYGT